jgi:hypothetical protein
MTEAVTLNAEQKIPSLTDNRDPRWSLRVDADIASKVKESMALKPRLELSRNGDEPVSDEERERVLLVTYREIVKATSLDTLMTAPPALLEQLAVLATVNNENVKAILVQVIRVFMMLWGSPDTNNIARSALIQMEQVVNEKLLAPAANPTPECLRWAPMPTK